jgi:catechol 2,3-dioxygenase-like lactoylglutathione lyase family enzyme
MNATPASERRPGGDGPPGRPRGRFVFNHLGQCVTDLDRSRRFYEAVLGFEFWRQITPPDESSSRLLGLDAPLGLTACYLRRDGLVLELLHFAAPAHGRQPQPRTMDEPGLTHLSISCDVAATRTRVLEYGGEVLDETDIGSGVFVRDPDGQLIELLPLEYADRVGQ